MAKVTETRVESKAQGEQKSNQIDIDLSADTNSAWKNRIVQRLREIFSSERKVCSFVAYMSTQRISMMLFAQYSMLRPYLSGDVWRKRMPSSIATSP